MSSANITINAKDFTSHPFAVRQAILTPVYSFTTDGANIVAADRLSTVTDASGFAVFSGVVSGNYNLQLIGPYKVTTVPLYVNQTGNVNATGLISADLVTPVNQVAYSQAQSDARFYPITGVPTGLVTTSQTGAFVTTGQTGAFYPRSNPSGYITTGQTGSFGGGPSNAVLLTGNQTISGVKTFVSGVTSNGQFYGASFQTTANQFGVDDTALNIAAPIYVEGEDSNDVVITNPPFLSRLRIATSNGTVDINGSVIADNGFSTTNNDFSVTNSGDLRAIGRAKIGATGTFISGTTLEIGNGNRDDYLNISGQNSNLVLSNPNADGRCSLSVVIDGNLKSKWRTDFQGNVAWVATSRHDFFVGGDYGVGTNAMTFNTDGSIIVYSQMNYSSAANDGPFDSSTPVSWLKTNVGGDDYWIPLYQ